MATTRNRRGRGAEAPTADQTASVQEDTVSDINDTEGQNEGQTEGQTAEAGTVAAGHKFNEGDEANVIRGKLRGLKGKIIARNEADKTYAVRLDSGVLAVVNEGNLKAPVDSTVSVTALVGVLAGLAPDEALTPTTVAALIDSVSPGFSAKLAEHTAA